MDANAPKKEEIKQENEEKNLTNVEEESESFPNFEKVLDMVGDIAITGRKVYLDKKFDLNDAQYIQPLIEKVPQYVKIDFKAAIEEVKKPSIIKVFGLVKLVGEKVKKFQAVV